LVRSALTALTAALEHTRGLGGGGGSSVDFSTSDDGASASQLTAKPYEELTDSLLAFFEVDTGAADNDLLNKVNQQLKVFITFLNDLRILFFFFNIF